MVVPLVVTGTSLATPAPGGTAMSVEQKSAQIKQVGMESRLFPGANPPLAKLPQPGMIQSIERHPLLPPLPIFAWREPFSLFHRRRRFPFESTVHAREPQRHPGRRRGHPYSWPSCRGPIPSRSRLPGRTNRPAPFQPPPLRVTVGADAVPAGKINLLECLMPCRSASGTDLKESTCFLG